MRICFQEHGDWSDDEDANAPPEIHANMDRLVRGSRRFSVVLNSQVEVPVEPTLVQTLRQMRKDAVHGNVDYTQLQGLDQNLIHFLLTRDDRLARKTIGKWRKYQNPERAYKAQKLRKTIEPPRRFMLPWYFAIVPWMLVIVTASGCSFLTILYTFNFGADKSLKWLRSFIVTLLGDILLTEPLNVIGFAVFFSIILRKNDVQRFDIKADKRSDIAPFNIRAIFNERVAVKVLRQNEAYKPPTKVRDDADRCTCTCTSTCILVLE